MLNIGQISSFGFQNQKQSQNNKPLISAKMNVLAQDTVSFSGLFGPKKTPLEKIFDYLDCDNVESAFSVVQSDLEHNDLNVNALNKLTEKLKGTRSGVEEDVQLLVNELKKKPKK